MKSPFDDLQIDPALVCEFFATFARFEYAMKATRYCKADRYHNAVPDWISLRGDLGGPLTASQDIQTQWAIAYLAAEPPLVQQWVNDELQWRAIALSGVDVGGSAIEAIRRVRNNLFHGGKHTPHSPADRDSKLINASLLVLKACLTLSPELKREFEHQLV